MPANAPTSTLRQDLEQRLADWLDQLEPAIRRHTASAAQEAREEVGDALNQAVRRLRQAAGVDEVFATLLEAAGAFCGGGAILRVEHGHALGERIRGVSSEAAARFAVLDVSLGEAPALAGAAASKDPVIAMATPGELSAALAEIAPGPGQASVAIFPVVAGSGTAALVCCWGNVQAGPIELLAQAAGLTMPAIAPPEKAPELITLAASLPAPGALPAASPATRRDHPENLPAEEQQLHLRAQRFARVRVSEIRLFQAEAVHAARLHSDLYGALRESIDSARQKFAVSFMTACPGMVDYYHLELVRTLANDNPALLGPDYPGPLV